MSSLTQILEGPRLDADINIKMDTSLENDLERERDSSSISSCSQILELEECHEANCCFNKFVMNENYYTCFHCGAFVSKNGVKTFKSNKMNYVPFFPSKTIYKTMTRRSTHLKQSSNPEYSQIRQVYVEWVLELADKLRISANSTHLAILLLDIVMYRDSSLTSRLQLYAPICLLIAAKAIELDERIPFIPKLRKYANPTFSIEDYRKAELHVLDMIDWNPQFSSALEISEFLMCQGVIFSNDQVEENNPTLSREKWSPEALRENTQRDNIYLESKEKALSSKLKENQENSFSDASTNIDNALTPYYAQNMLSEQVGDISPSTYSLRNIQKQHSTPANFETCKSENKNLVAIQDKIEEILSHFDANYLNLSTLLLKDIEFLQWEPKVVSAAMMTFLRSVNRITPIWNDNLEAITQLKFLQISQCYDLIYKKYKNIFTLHSHKVLSVIPSSENQNEVSSGLRLTKASSNVSEKCLQQKTELANKTNLLNNAIADQKVLDKKVTSTFQIKNSVPILNSTVSTIHMRDDLRVKTRYGNGTINTELPPRNSAKNPMMAQTALNAVRYDSNLEAVENYFNHHGITTDNVVDASYSNGGIYPSIAYMNTRTNI